MSVPKNVQPCEVVSGLLVIGSMESRVPRQYCTWELLIQGLPESVLVLRSKGEYIAWMLQGHRFEFEETRISRRMPEGV